MEADWIVACAADDPVVVVPWSGEDHTIRFIDLREAPERVSEIPEAAHHAALMAALRAWNQPNAPMFTAKCDIWTYDADRFDAEDLPGFAYAQGSYIDLLARDPGIFTSFAASEQGLRKWTEVARSIPVSAARCEWTLRPARILPAVTEQSRSEINGFATTSYVWGYGSNSADAAEAWSAAVLALIEPVMFSQL